MIYVPKRIFFTKGVGSSTKKLKSFEEALRDAGIAPYNLVHVSSIFPRGAKLISREEGLKEINGLEGAIIHCVMARDETDENQRLVYASVGCAMPKDGDMYGYLSEHHGYGKNKELAGDEAEDLAFEMLAETMGLTRLPQFDLNKSYDEHKEEWRIQDHIYKTLNVTQTAEGKQPSSVGDCERVYTTVIAAAILLPSEEEMKLVREKYALSQIDYSQFAEKAQNGIKKSDN